MNHPRPDPLAAMRLGFAMARLAAEANAVIAMRMMGLAGLWSTAPSETMRMVTEKPAAFAKAATAATRAAAKGRDPVSAALRPLSREATANRRRLAKRGPKLPGSR